MHRTAYWKCNFPMVLSARPFVGWSVGRSVCHDFLKGREVTLPGFYQSICLFNHLFVFVTYLISVCGCPSFLDVGRKLFVFICLLFPSLYVINYQFTFQGRKYIHNRKDEIRHGFSQSVKCVAPLLRWFRDMFLAKV